MVCKDTLRVKHLPKELTDAQKEDFIRHFGPFKVKVITSKAKAKSVVYAKFENEDIAKNVMFRLHQINILNCRLSVEYAETDILQGQLSAQKVDDSRDRPDKRFFKNFINNINAFNDSVGFYQPPPSHLKYNYPKANRSTINNIAHALATVPRFYTQVLHLMNKMSLPPPFAMPEPPVRTIPGVQSSQPSVTVQNPQTISEKRKAPSSSESEMESDGEASKNKEIIPQRKAVAQKKTLKRPKFIKQLPVQSSVPSKPAEKPENVFEKVKVYPQRKIELRVIQDPVAEKPESVKGNVTTPKTKTKIFDKDTKEVSKPTKSKDDKLSQEALGSLNVTSEQSGPPLITKNEVSTDFTREFKPKSIESEPIGTKPQLQESVIDELKKPDTVIGIESSHLLQSQPESISSQHLEFHRHRESLDKQQEVISITPEIEQELQKHDPVNRMEVQEELVEGSIEIQLQIQQVENIIQQDKITKISAEHPLSDDEFPCISLEELAANQVTDLTVMPVFKNYSAGLPTNKLYIKNCAKTVVAQDLEYIYNRYREEGTEEKPSEFNIRLMKEGRMKGQAFVTLDSIEEAKKAVKETNGFILKDKPLVVVFGKAGKKK